MSKSEILADAIEPSEIENLQSRIDNNSKLINDMTNKLVADYCKQLDKYMLFIKGLLENSAQPPIVDELEDFVMNLPVLLYFCGEAQENLGIKTDVAKAIKQERYNEVYRELEKGTINDKVSKAELASRSEEITRIIYDRAYKIVKEKRDAAYELVSSIKKVLSRRIEEAKLSNIDDGSFRERRN